MPEEFLVNSVFHPITGRAMEYRDLISDPVTKTDWELSSANEFGRLFQGVGDRIKGTNRCFFIKKDDVKKHSSYARSV